MLLIFIVVLSLPSIVLGEPKVESFRKLDLSKFSVGPESIAFDRKGKGPYASLSDGRIVKYELMSKSFQEFSFTQPNRSKTQCDGQNIRDLWPICGRPLGLDFYYSKNQLYIADRFLGLLVAGPNKGVAKQLATSANGVAFQFTNGLSVDQYTGDVYFTDMTNRLLQSPNNTKSGRLLKYEQKTGNVSVILSGIGNANGVAVSTDASFLLLVEASEKRVLKVWLKGPKALTSKVVFNYDGRPDNIKKTPSKDQFWVAFNFNEPNKPSLVPSRAIKIDGDGKILDEFNPGPYYNTTTITELNMRGSKFYIGSIEAGYVGAFSTK